MMLAILVVATLLPVGALAQWTPLVTTQDSEVYADRGNARRAGSVVRIKSVTDVKRPLTFKEGVVQSVVADEEYDCGQRRLKVLSLRFHGGAKGGGEVVLASGQPGEWAPIEQGSPAESKLKVICDWFPGKR